MISLSHTWDTQQWVEVHPLGPGPTNGVSDSAQWQRQLPRFADGDEPSAHVLEARSTQGDPSSLHTFTVGSAGHIPHRHRGRRCFVALTGNGGLTLRFAPSVTTAAQLVQHAVTTHVLPHTWVAVRFAPMVWHEFSPTHPASGPALFAFSFHPNDHENETPTDESLQGLTEILPSHFLEAWRLSDQQSDLWRRAWDKESSSHDQSVIHLESTKTHAGDVLEEVLDRMLTSPPLSVSLLMKIRNVLVRPLGWRRASLGCPVSSLASCPMSSRAVFRNRFPVWAASSPDNQDWAAVMLGADDKHLAFRSMVSVSKTSNGWLLGLETRVSTHSWAGRWYWAMIDRVHRTHVAPALLRAAASHPVSTVMPMRRPPPSYSSKELGKTV